MKYVLFIPIQQNSPFYHCFCVFFYFNFLILWYGIKMYKRKLRHTHKEPHAQQHVFNYISLQGTFFHS